jgi:DNA-binding MarR family transcriptional regulator
VSDRAAAFEDFGRAFRALSAAMRRLQGRDTHRPDGLSFAQYKLLFELYHLGDVTAGELAAAAALAPASASQMLDNLAGLGLIERVRSEQDRRNVVIRLTKQGTKQVAARRKEIEPLWNAALAEFSDSELHSAAAVLERLRAMFEELAEER